ncbi:CpaE family protein [Amycolatopsis japonica]|uniref:CpaE family protein n=1 Tax=Amycolatopsis japonica TaxID=208439 RepID=UPI00379A40FD
MQPPREPGRIVAVVAATSGYGKTTVAASLAAVLTARTRRVCLVDLDVVFGDLTGLLGLEPRRGPMNADAVIPLWPGLDCLPAPVRPPDPLLLRPEELLTSLAAAYDFVVVDTQAQLTTTVLSVLDRADDHLLVSAPERLALRGLRRTLELLDLLSYRAASRAVVLNRCDPRSELDAGEVDALAGAPIAARLPFTPDVPACANKGVVLALEHPEHPFGEALRRFADARLTHIRPSPPQGR